MVEPYLRRSPLAHLGLAARAAAARAGAGIVLGERAHRCQIDLRGDAADPALAQAVAEAAGLTLPIEPNTVAEAGALAALWLGPDEWLIVGPPGREAELAPRLRGALGRVHAAVTDVSEARTTIAVAGPRARDLLAKGTPLDLHPRVFGPRACAQTGLAKVNVILRRTDDRPTFEIYLPKSFADHVWTWLEAAAEEYGVAVAAD